MSLKCLTGVCVFCDWVVAFSDKARVALFSSDRFAYQTCLADLDSASIRFGFGR